VKEQLIKVYRRGFFRRNVAKQYQRDATQLSQEGWRVVTNATNRTLFGPEVLVTYERKIPDPLDEMAANMIAESLHAYDLEGTDEPTNSDIKRYVLQHFNYRLTDKEIARNR
jgi:hypothetical protein